MLIFYIIPLSHLEQEAQPVEQRATTFTNTSIQ